MQTIRKGPLKTYRVSRPNSSRSGIGMYRYLELEGKELISKRGGTHGSLFSEKPLAWIERETTRSWPTITEKSYVPFCQLMGLSQNYFGTSPRTRVQHIFILLTRNEYNPAGELIIFTLFDGHHRVRFCKRVSSSSIKKLASSSVKIPRVCSKIFHLYLPIILALSFPFQQPCTNDTAQWTPDVILHQRAPAQCHCIII